MNTKGIKVGIIGGSGLYDLDSINVIEKIEADTPFGHPSSPIIIVENKAGYKAAFLSRHARGHHILPSEIPAKSNIYALKALGVKSILSISAVGSLQENIQPKSFVLPDQIVDRTKRQSISFFGNGLVAHVDFSDPYCCILNKIVYETIKNKDVVIHQNGTYVCIEGPAFSTRAESRIYQSWGASIIGMTAIPEAKLAREAEISYSTLAMVTDFDCWKKRSKIEISEILDNMNYGTGVISKVIPQLITAISEMKSFPYKNALKNSFITRKEFVPIETKKKLKLFYEKYW